MNKVGIGNFKHAKPQTIKVPSKSTAASVKKDSNLTGSAPKTKQTSKTQKKREGQLAVDIYQSEHEMTIVCPIAGVKKEEVKVAIQDDVLTIRGTREKLESLELRTPIVRELFWGEFSRSIVLPDHIDRKNIQARVFEHLLIITIPKTEDFKTRIIHINEE